MNASTIRWTIPLVVLLASTGCRDSFDGAELDGISTREGTGTCPVPGPLPFETTSSSFESDASNEWLTNNPYVTHSGQDLLGANAGNELSGTMTRSSGTLLTQRGVENEWVSAWRRDPAGGWVQLGRVKTDNQGNFTLPIPSDQSFDVGTGSVFSILEGDGTCTVHGVFVWPAGTQVILTDIDGTITFDDNELLKQLMDDPGYVPKENQSASEMLNTWADKGYRVVYLSARPDNLRGISREWLHGVGAPFGPFRTAGSFVYGESAREYKADFIEYVKNDLGWQIVAAYGNAGSDIRAYEDAGIGKDVTFIIGERAGESGTVAIGNNDYTDHISSYVQSQPDAQQPF
ncbi:MAG: hypothetical protein ACOC1F_13425 [Myxococcota bacterium]